ncbi:3,4-dihydroxy-2-butanone 4-phosphate synthase [Xylariomycetidae sp. FL0641]|nr:3,4-dihydroxy-2-butanone 4-phosphate synthase [Xylariomycetidae sp. FL0641]KAI0026154.1 3,4-dihydroxy-2-butanone 4-phosphate synthase [Xylariomycetidae sp. FL0641]
MPSAEIDHNKFDTIPDTVEAFRNGEFIVVMDDPGRENEGDLIIAAEGVSAEQMAFMVRYSSGLVCAPISGAEADRLGLAPMVPDNQDPRGTAYTVSVDAADAAVTTGIGAHDRALTVRALAGPGTAAADLRRPGHVFPLRARDGGVRVRRGHTEAALDFCRLAAKRPAAAICEIVDDGAEVQGQALRRDPGMLRGEGCVAFARKWGLRVCTIADLADYLEKMEGKAGANGSA